ncbi:MAG: chorismate synthase [Alphaproteobacteria bacterium]|nr:chorismate synthase [Alphaproteobacteria bacterium]
MPGNSFGRALVLTGWGESHGAAIGGALDGMPPGIAVDIADIQSALDRRAPGGSRFVSQRRETDTVEILSGIYEGRTTGHPVAFMIANSDARPRDYSAIKDLYRPSHADWSWRQKYGVRDPRGGGRSSARETAVRVAAGALALMVLRHLFGDGASVRGALIELGGDAVSRDNWDWNEIPRNPFFCPDADAVARWEKRIDDARKDQNSLGAVCQVEARGVPAGLGEPVYDRLDADIAKALMSINAVKGVEVGAGFAAARMTGAEHADEMRSDDSGKDDSGGVKFLSNNAGGVLGGVSSGQPVVARFALKPTSSLARPLRTVDTGGAEVEAQTKGRHDPCVGIRAVPIGEAMLALVLADHALRQRGQCGGFGVAPG